MTSKEKAQELLHKFKCYTGRYYNSKRNTITSKQCALIAVDEILEATKMTVKWGGGNPDKLIHLEEEKYDTYWLEVKQEIEQL